MKSALFVLLGELINSGVEGLAAPNKQSGHDFRVGFETGLFEFGSGVLSKYVAPEDAPGIGPDKEAGGPKNVTVETQRFAASAGELPPILQLVFVVVFNEMPLEKLLYGIRALVQ